MAREAMPVGGMRPVESAGAGADLVVCNAKICTGDPANPAATAVAIKDGVFVGVGGDEEVARHIGTNTRIVDALNRRAIPGFNDSHPHVIRGGNNYVLELRWDGVPSLRRGLAMLREQADRPRRDSGCGWSGGGPGTVRGKATPHAEDSTPQRRTLRCSSCTCTSPR